MLDAYEETLDLSVYLRQALYEIEDQQRRTSSGSVGSLCRLEESYDGVLDILANLKDVLYARR